MPIDEHKRDVVAEARELLSRTSDAAKRVMLVGRVTRCEIANFPSIAPADTAPVAYVADAADAQLFARAPNLLNTLCDQYEHLLTTVRTYLTTDNEVEIEKWAEAERELERLAGLEKK